MIVNFKTLFTTLALSSLLLYVASITIFKPEPPLTFINQITQYQKIWECANFYNCHLYIYPDSSGKKSGVRYSIPPDIIKKIIQTYLREGKLKYS